LSGCGAGRGTRGLQSHNKDYFQYKRQAGRRVQYWLTLDNNRQRLNQTEGAKYTDESNITRWRQVILMNKMRNRWLMREWVQEWRQEDPGKCSADDKTDWCRRGLWHISCHFIYHHI